MVIVNTVVFVQSRFGLAQNDTALALAAFGGGSMLVALVLPRVLDRMPDRPVMLASVGFLIAGLVATALVQSYQILLFVWFLIGIGYSGAQTPSGRLLRRSGHAEDRPALFAAQFALSHACWLITYPLAGWLGAKIGLPATALLLCAIAVVGLFAALWLWPSTSEKELLHSHTDLSEDHNHWSEGVKRGPRSHSHTVVIDSLHPAWPHEQ